MKRGTMMTPIDSTPADRRGSRARRLRVGTLVVIAGAILATHVTAQNNANQVVAKIGSTEITRAMLRQEMPGGVDNPAIERAVLQSMVARKLLAEEARHQGLDRTPVGAMVLKRADEMTTVGLLEQKYAGTPQAVSDAQVRDFIAAHPLMFAQRHLIALDQYLASDVSKATTKSLEAANSMAEFNDVLSRDRVSFQRGAVVIDTLNLAPAAGAKLSSFGPNQVFITPRPDGSLILSGVTSNTLAPVTGVSAERMARLILQRSSTLR